MNKRIFTVAVATMVMGIGLQAQNNGNTGLTLKDVGGGYSKNNRIIENFDGKHNQKIQVSDGLKVKSISENSYAIQGEIKNQPSATKINWEFKLTIEGEWNFLAVINGDDFLGVADPWDLEGNVYETTLPEGYYDIFISGGESLDDRAFLFFEQIFIGEDTDMKADFEDAIYFISIAPLDINNVLINDWAGENSDIVFDFYFSTQNLRYWSFFFDSRISDCMIRFNDIKMNRNKIIATLISYNEITGDYYIVEFQPIEEISGDIVLENSSDEFYHFEQMINIPENFEGVLYSKSKWIRFWYNFELGRHGWFSINTDNRVRDKNIPYSLFSNIRYNDSPQTGETNTFVMPISSDFYDEEDWNEIQGSVVGNPMAMNDKGELIMNFFPKFNSFIFYDINEIISSLGNNPHTKVWNKEEYYYEGYRTPILYHQSLNITAETNPFEEETIVGDYLFLFLGEYSEQKYNHSDMIAKITGDGIEIFNDSIYKLSYLWLWDIILDDTRSQYHIEIFNDDVFAYGKKMKNHSIIDFDMTKTDVNPPTLTMLRIIDNEKISMFISDVNTARLEITTGDFELEFEEYYGWYLENFAYNKKPDIEIFWSSDNETFYELPALEDESKFHPGYGNFFNVSLAPLAEAGIDEGWITIKIILTDEVGNSQVQLLDPLFYYGDFVGIDKQILSNKLTSSAYPNPFTEKITVELENPVSGLTYFEIYDITGRIIHQQKTDANNTKSFTYNGKHLKAGVYFYGIYNGGNVVSGKIVKN